LDQYKVLIVWIFLLKIMFAHDCGFCNGVNMVVLVDVAVDKEPSAHARFYGQELTAVA
jgi:hypothetical protein